MEFAAYRLGAPLAFIDTMQYHPTGAVFPEQILGQLVTGKVRGLGAQVCNVAGEASGGVHGRNRLMGNSLLDIVVFGQRTGLAAGQHIKDIALGKPTLDHLNAWNKELDAAGMDGHVSPVLLPRYTKRDATVSLTL